MSLHLEHVAISSQGQKH